jgi:hypothetical protein
LAVEKISRPVSISGLPVRSTNDGGRNGRPPEHFEGDAMRKIVAGLMMSVDGVVEAPETWTGPYFSPEIGQVVGSVMANGDTMLMGRVTYQTFAASFAGNSSDPMAAQLNAIPKVVV